MTPATTGALARSELHGHKPGTPITRTSGNDARTSWRCSRCNALLALEIQQGTRPVEATACSGSREPCIR